MKKLREIMREGFLYVVRKDAMVAEAALLYIVAKRRLGIHVFIWRRR